MNPARAASPGGTASPADAVRAEARAAGFHEVGIARVENLRDTEEGSRLLRWLEEGGHGTMAWLARDPARRLDPARVLPGARSVVVVALSYLRGEPEGGGEGTGAVARYARRRDYHRIFSAGLRRLEAGIMRLLPGAATRRYVDTGPVLEKFWAERAGIGWRGKHTHLVSRRHGSWLLLGVVLVDRDLEPDAPERDRCGTCRRCVEVCPTGAITVPYALDARRCIAYLTIEHRGSIPEALRPAMGNHVFGCDDCLDVCPWNRFAIESDAAGFECRPEALAPLLVDLVALDEAGFLDRFAGTPIVRAKREGLARNACVALGNVGGPGDLPALAAALDDPSPVVREHAGWAIRRIEERDAAGG